VGPDVRLCAVYCDDDDVVVEDRPLTVHTDMVLVARAMSRVDSGLEIRDRLWLKITIPHAFIGRHRFILGVSVSVWTVKSHG